MASLSVASCGPEGAELLARLHAGGFERSWETAQMMRFLTSTGVQGLVLMEGETPLAMALIRAIAGEAELLTIAVPQERRGQGLGRRLVEAGMEAARRAGAEQMFLEVSDRNAPAEALYRKCGFADAGRRKAYYKDGSDALVLARRL
ncbi:MAG: ribosomal protein S18-alanine N-acetyltransferase [Oceanicaulis sp.]